MSTKQEDNMLLTEILDKAPLLEMAYTKKKAEIMITGLEKPINDHLLKIWTMPDDANLDHWKMEVTLWLDEIGDIVLKPSNRRPRADFYFRILFDEPFGGAEVPNVTSRLKRLRLQGSEFTADVSPEGLAKRLRGFHAAFSKSVASGAVDDSSISQLIGS